MEIGVVAVWPQEKDFLLFRRIALCSASPWQLWLMDYIESVCVCVSFSVSLPFKSMSSTKEMREEKKHSNNNGIEMNMIKMKEKKNGLPSQNGVARVENGRNWFRCW